MNNWKIDESANLAAPAHRDAINMGIFAAGDDRAHEWRVRVWNGPERADLSGSTATLNVLRPDGKTVLFEAQVAGSVVSVTFPDACYAQEGAHMATLRLINPDGSRVTLGAMHYYCRIQTSDENVEPENALLSVAEIVERLEAAEAAAKAAATPDWDDVQNRPESYPPEAHRHVAGDVDGLAEVATSGSYGDLSGTEGVATKEYVEEQISAIEIGGRNYLLGINQGIANWDWNFGNKENTAIFTETSLYGRKGVRIVRNESTDSTGWSTLIYRNVNLTGLIEDEDYTFSMYIRTNRNLDGLNINIMNEDASGRILENNSFLPTINASSEFAKVSANLHTNKTFPAITKQAICIYVGSYGKDSSGAVIEIFDAKLERGNKATDWSPAPEDTDRAISRRSAVTYDYGGRNLKEIFGTPEALHAALAAEDYTNIAVGDYWPITLNGTFWDYGEGDDHMVRNCSNVVVKLEVAGINHYWRYGDSGDLTDNKPHIVFVSRDCLPFSMAMRKEEYKWEDETATNPWVGSALYKTLNDPDHGIIHLLMQTELGPYIYSGPNGKGMRAMMETKGPSDTNATSWAWYDRGKLFLPSITEVFGCPFFAEPNLEGLANQLSIFRDSRRHISKGYGDSGSKAYWWLSSSSANVNNCFVHITYAGNFSSYVSTSKYSVPICFIFA